MLNATNVIGWANLLFRMLLNLGLVAVVNFRYGVDAVKPWMIYITVIASIQAADGLISQFFIREILRTSRRPDLLRNCYVLQARIYVGLSIVFAIIAFQTMGDGLAYKVAIPIGLFCFLKIYDSRARSHLDITTFQKVDLVLNVSLTLVLIVAAATIGGFEAFLLVHAYALSCALVAKSRVTAKQSESVLPVAERISGQVHVGFWSTVLIAFGGGLSVNVALLVLQSVLRDDVSAGFLLAYRVSALVCEMASLPLIVRIPEITRALVAGDFSSANAVFKRNYVSALLLCSIGFVVLNVLAPFWNDLVPVGLNIEGGVLLLVISVGWLLERIGTLMSQFLLSLKDYGVSWVYVIYLLVIVASIVASRTIGSVLAFPIAVVIANLIVVTGVIRRRMQVVS